MCKRICKAVFTTLYRSSSGVALTEVVIAIVVLAFILASVPAVLVFVVNSQYTWNEQRVAESLSRNQVEYIKVAQYIQGNATHPLPQYAEVPTPNPSYDVDVVAQPIDASTKNALPEGQDEGMQEINIKIYHADKLVLQTTNYKIDRLGVLAQ